MPCASSSANNQNYMDNGDLFTQVNINKEVLSILSNVIKYYVLLDVINSIFQDKVYGTARYLEYQLARN